MLYLTRAPPSAVFFKHTKISAFSGILCFFLLLQMYQLIYMVVFLGATTSSTEFALIFGDHTISKVLLLLQSIVFLVYTYFVWCWLQIW